MKPLVPTLLQAVLMLPALLFTVTGLRWWVAPAGAAEQLGMPLLHGTGLSSQIGDLAAFFLVIGLFLLTGIASRVRHWFVAPVALLVLAAVSRVLAWALHDAALAVPMIAVELVMAGLVWFASGRLCARA